jgi:thioredoxin reductase
MTAAQNDLPVAIIGGGPVGLAAAAHLLTRGVPARLYEAGDRVGAHVRNWGHVRLFSPWGFNVDTAAKAILREHGWQEPSANSLPTGNDLFSRYLEPLAQTPALRGVIETGARIRTVSRQGIDKVVSHARAEHPFALAVEGANGPRIELVRAVIDASGTWSNPNPLFASSADAVDAHAARIAYGIPDVLGADRSKYSHQRVLVVGGGHSAANVLIDLAKLAENDPRLEVIWAARSKNLTRVFGGGAADKLQARGKLGQDLKRLVDDGRIKLALGFAIETIEGDDAGLVVVDGSKTRRLGPVDRIIVCTGQRPDLAMTRELRVDLNPWLESARALGPLIDPNVHSCGSVPPHGYKELAHPEPDYFAVGIKSYGRAPTFLLATGYEQVRSVAAHLAGDHAAANDVRLVLPETGVCSTALSPASEGCCGGPAPAGVDACCKQDTDDKARGKVGCGCTTSDAKLEVAALGSGGGRNG